MSRRKSATPKERVLALMPWVECWQCTHGGWHVAGFDCAKTPQQAWADAAKRLRGKR